MNTSLTDEYYNSYQEANIDFNNKQYKKAFSKFIYLAKEDYVCALNMIGYMYLEGYGVKKNEKKTIFWWEKASACDSVYAKFQLGCLFIRNDSINKGLAYIKEAQENNYPDAMYLIAGYYYHGTHLEKNQDLAISIYKNAALLGNEDAARDLMKALYHKYGGVKTFFKGIILSIILIKNKLFTRCSSSHVTHGCLYQRPNGQKA